MSSGHGGARKGAGRKKGSVNRRTRELSQKTLDRIEDAGEVLPIEVMYDVMKASYETWVASGRSDQDAADKAAYWAEKSAPFFHAKLSSVTIDTDESDFEVAVKDHKAAA